MADYPSSEDMLREFRASATSPPTSPDATAPPVEEAPAPPPPPPPPPPPGSGDPFVRRGPSRAPSRVPAREPYDPDTAPATGDDRHAEWTAKGRAGSPRNPSTKSRFGRLRPLLVLVAIGAIAFGNISELFDSSTSVAELTVGDCFNGADGELIESVDVVDCGEAHEFEVYARPAFTGSGAYPGADALFAWADEQCWEAFEPYVGLPFEESELWFTNFIPTDESWEQGNRRATCMLHRYGDGFEVAPSVGSYRNTGV